MASDRDVVSSLALIAVAGLIACTSVNDHFAPGLAIEEASYPESYAGPKPVSARQALRCALQSLEGRGVTDARLRHIHWMVAGYGAAIIHATGRWEKEGVSFNAFAVAIADGTEAKQGFPGGKELWVIARGTEKTGAETYYHSALAPAIQRFSEIERDPDQEFIFEAVSREELARLAASQLFGERKRIERWPLLEHLIREKSSVLPADAEVFAFAEIYRGDEAVLLGCASMSETLIPIAARFERTVNGWSLQPRFARESEIDALLGAGDVRVVRRHAGVPLDLLPYFLEHVLSDRAREFREASTQRHFKQCAAIADEMLIGFRADCAPIVLGALGSPANISKIRLIATSEEPEGRLLATFEAEDGSGPATSRYILAREGSGWVIVERFGGAAARTIARIQDLAAAMESFRVDHDETYPQAASLEELRQTLQPKYMPSVPLLDAWRTPIRVETGKDARTYRLISAGADRTFHPESWAIADQELGNFDEDAVFENGSFVRKWRTSD